MPSGTPARLATVIPAIIPATASVTLPGGASLERIMVPTPKNAPCGKPDTSRPIASMVYEVEKVKMALPITHSVTRNSRMVLSENLLEKSAIIGAPITTPKA
ncbi:hypothetical protein D3C75_821460 [compost metagenome]